MEFILTKNKNTIKLYVDKKEVKYKNNYCLLIGNIYNLNDLDKSKIKKEGKILKLYEKYKEKLFDKLDGEYAILIIYNGKVLLVRDKLGTRHFYYYKSNDTFICSNDLKEIINRYKSELVIDKRVLASYLSYYYINEPFTIFERVYKLKSGYYLIYDNKVVCKKYYDLVKYYKENRNKINCLDEAVIKLQNDLINSIKKRSEGKNKIGVFLSSGVDSTLLVCILNSLGKKLNTYTVAFNEKDYDESKKAKELAKKVGANHHEFLLTNEKAKELVHNAFKIYSEPFCDYSMIPVLLLNDGVDKDLDVLLTGDGADQLFMGSNIYARLSNFKFITRILKEILRPICKANSTFAYKIYKEKLYTYKESYGVKNKMNDYMLFDIKTFLSNRLFTKESVPINYHNINVAYPYVDMNVVNDALMINKKLKFKDNIFKKNIVKKYVLRNVLYKYVDKNDLSNSKKGFSVPIKKWMNDIFYDDVKNMSSKEVLDKQGIFDYELINKQLEYIKEEYSSKVDSYTIFAYYMFQLWYKEYIEDIWK